MHEASCLCVICLPTGKCEPCIKIWEAERLGLHNEKIEANFQNWFCMEQSFATLLKSLLWETFHTVTIMGVDNMTNKEWPSIGPMQPDGAHMNCAMSGFVYAALLEEIICKIWRIAHFLVPPVLCYKIERPIDARLLSANKGIYEIMLDKFDHKFKEIVITISL